MSRPDHRRQHRLRVAMFPMMTRKDAASRLFCYQWVPYLRHQGIDATVYPPSSVWLFELLCEARFSVPRQVFKALYWYNVVPLTRLLQILHAMRSDVLFIQRGMLRYKSAPTLELIAAWLARKRGARIIYNYDDALYLHANENYYHKRFALANLVVTGNRELASYAQEWAAGVALLEAPVDLEYYHPASSTEREGPVVIGWTGTNLRDLGGIREALREVAQLPNVRIVVVGPKVQQAHLDPSWGYVRWRLDEEILNLTKFDIGIMPLADTQYNRAKEGYKIKQYMAMGIATVASPVGKNCELIKHGVNGFLARNSREWIDYLCLLVNDKNLRQQMGAEGRQFVEQRYSMTANGPAFVTLLHGTASADTDTIRQTIYGDSSSA